MPNHNKMRKPDATIMPVPKKAAAKRPTEKPNPGMPKPKPKPKPPIQGPWPGLRGPAKNPKTVRGPWQGMRGR